MTEEDERQFWDAAEETEDFAAYERELATSLLRERLLLAAIVVLLIIIVALVAM